MVVLGSRVHSLAQSHSQGTEYVKRPEAGGVLAREGQSESNQACPFQNPERVFPLLICTPLTVSSPRLPTPHICMLDGIKVASLGIVQGSMCICLCPKVLLHFFPLPLPPLSFPLLPPSVPSFSPSSPSLSLLSFVSPLTAIQWTFTKRLGCFRCPPSPPHPHLPPLSHPPEGLRLWVS